MRKINLIFLLFFPVSGVFSQFSTDKLEFRIGYDLHNARANRFNHMIESFNNSRYPYVISKNLQSLNFLRGLTFGANYRVREDLIVHAVFKNKNQFLETTFIENNQFYKFYFRENTVEAGITFPIREEKRFSHYAGGGIYFGVMSVYSDWSTEKGFKGTKEMFNIDQTSVAGLSLNYEVRFKVLDNAFLYLRPVAQFALRSNVRNLNSFMNPEIAGSAIYYSPGEDEKYNNGSLGGLGVEGGVVIKLPEFKK